MSRIFLFFLFVLTLYGASASVEEFDTKFYNSNKTQKLEIYQNLKGTYLNSILNDDDKLKIETLRRLIKAAKDLDSSYEIYQRDLDSLLKKENANHPKKSSTFLDEGQNKISNSSIPKIFRISSSKNELILHLNGDINGDSLKMHALNTKDFFRTIFDINADLAIKFVRPKDMIVDNIRIAQFDKKTVRIVFYTDKDTDIKSEIKGRRLIFTAGPKSIKNSNEKPKATAKTPSPQKKPPKVEMKNKTIVIDPGHGGKDSGAIGFRTLYEKNVVLKIALKAGKILKDRGYKVYFTRSKDEFIGLRNRTSFANEKMADLFISIHANAAPDGKKATEAHGVETFFLSPTRSERSMRAANLENKADTDEMNYFTKISFLNFLNREKIIASNKLAIDIQANILKSLRESYKVADGGVREAPFWVLVGALMPAVLIETGYITHPREGKLLANDAYEHKLAVGIANGVDDYFIKNR